MDPLVVGRCWSTPGRSRLIGKILTLNGEWKRYAGLNLMRFVLVVGSLLSLGLIGLPKPVHIAVFLLTALALAGVLVVEKGDSKFRLWSIYLVLFLLFVHLRGYAEETFFTVRFDYIIDIERRLFFGVMPTEWLQSHLYSGRMDALVFAVAGVWSSYFLVPHLSLLVAWKLDPKNAVRNTAAYILTYYLGLLIYFLVPTAPPWAASFYHYLPEGCHRILSELGMWVNYKTYILIYDTIGEPNNYAAMPSVHVAITCIVSLMLYEAKYWPFRVLAVLYVLAMSFSLVFLGEHYVTDILAGILVGLFSWIVSSRFAGERSPGVFSGISRRICDSPAARRPD